VKFAVGWSPVDPLSKTARIARLAEELGYDSMGLADQRESGERDVYVALALCAGATEKIRLGPCVSDPYSRCPAIAARAIASLDELSGGRTYIALGAGGSGFTELGIKQESPNRALRETIKIMRTLFQGRKVFYDGKIFQVRGHDLSFGSRSDLKIYVATRSPRNLKLAGELADGVLIATYATEEQIRWAIEKVEEGARIAGRSLHDIDLISWMYTSVSEDRDEAIRNVKPFVLQALCKTAPEMYPKFELNEKVISILQQMRHLPMSEITRQNPDVLTDRDVERFSLAGTPDDCLRKAEEIRDAGIDQIWIRPFSRPGLFAGVERIIDVFGRKVLRDFG